MPHVASFLEFVAPVFAVVSALHLVLGAGAEVLLGARLPTEALVDPALNGQNRFYGGVALSLFWVLFYLWHRPSEIRYGSALRGLARLVNHHLWCAPPPVLALLVTEIALPPLLHLWQSNVPLAG